MKDFTLRGWTAIGISFAAAFGALLSLYLALNIGGAVLIVSPQGVTNFDTLQVGDGSVSEPAFGFTSDTDVGFYRVGANDIGVSAGGSKVGDFTSSGWTGGVSVGSNDLSGRNITATGTANVAGATALNGGLTMDTSAFSVANTTGNTVISGTLTVTSTGSVVGNLTASAFVIHASQSITPTDGAPITPTNSLIVLTPAAEVTPTIAACVTNGTQLVLYNQEAQSINLADADNFILTGALVLTQYDTVPLVCVATKWVQVGPVSAN